MANNSRRRKRSAPVGLIVVVTALLALTLLATTMLFKVENIVVKGESVYEAEEIIQMSGVHAGDNLFRTNLNKCAKRLENRLVYIEKAEIKRSFPSTLVINITPCEPCANIITETYCLLISGQGKVLEQCELPKAKVLDIRGAEPALSLLPGDTFVSADEHKTDVISQLMSYFSKDSHNEISSHVTGIDVTDRSGITYTYDNRIDVNMGTVNDIEYKIQFSSEIITNKLGEGTEGRLTILSDSSRASFIDKATIEENEQHYQEKMAELEEQSESETEESSTEGSEESTELTSME